MAAITDMFTSHQASRDSMASKMAPIRQKALIEKNPDAIPRWQDPEKRDITDVKPKGALGSAMDKDLDENFDIFLKLFITQMEHPDPTESNSSLDMIQNLLQFFLAHGQQTTNDKLGSIQKSLDTSQARSAENWVGRDIYYEANCFTYKNGLQEGEYDVDHTLEGAELRVFTYNDDLVDTITMDKSLGRHDFKWDPKERKEHLRTDVEEGNVYKISLHGMRKVSKNGVVQKDGEGREIMEEVNIPLRLKGHVDAVDYEDGFQKPVLLVGKNAVDFENTKRLHEAATRMYEKRPVAPEALAQTIIG
jgi:flagellar basal-body rod modification protein FlgD